MILMTVKYVLVFVDVGPDSADLGESGPAQTLDLGGFGRVHF